MARSSLADALKPKAAPARAAAAKAENESKIAPSRRGLRAVTYYLDPAAHQQLRIMAIELNRPVHGLIKEATNDLFQKYGKARIAE